MRFIIFFLFIAVNSISFGQDEQHYITYHDSDHVQKRSEGDMLDGKETGLWKFWFPSGKLMEETEYRRGFVNGKQVV